MSKQPSPSPLFTLRGNMDGILNLLFHINKDSEFLYASTQSGKIHKWDLQKCREIFEIEASKEGCLAIKRLHNQFISQAKGGEVRIWEESNGVWSLKLVFNTDYWGFCKVELTADSFLVCPCPDSKIKIFSFLEGSLNTVSVISKDQVKCGEIMALKCCVYLDIEYILILYESGLLAIFKGDGTEIADFKLNSGCPMALDVDGDFKIVIGTSEDVITGLELTKDFSLVKRKEVLITNPGVSCLAIRPDKKLFAAGCWDSRIRLFSMKSFKLLAVLENHSQSIQDIRYSLKKVEAWDCQWLLAAAGQDGRISLWSIY